MGVGLHHERSAQLLVVIVFGHRFDVGHEGFCCIPSTPPV